MTKCIKDLVTELPKSPLPAGAATTYGSYPFFVSGPLPLCIDKAICQGPAIILSTGGNAAVHFCETRYSYSTDTWALRPKESEIDGKYLYYFIASQLEKIAVLGFEGSGLKHLRKDFIRDYIVPFFPRPEQSKIAEILSTVDRAIEQTEALIAKQQRIKAGLMHDLLTRGIDEHGNLRSEATHKFKDSPLGRIPVEWEVKPLSQLANVDRGKFTHRPRDDARYYGGKYPFIQTGDVTANLGRIVNCYTQTLSALGTTVSKEFPTNTIAVTIAANIADTAILGQPMYFPDSVVGVVVTRPNSVRFVEMMIRRAKLSLEKLAPKSAQSNINLEVLRPLPIATPKPEEQERIATVYESADLILIQYEESLTKLRRLKSALMQDLLTGRRRVTALLNEKDGVGA